jgi:NADH-quinone oxidoreductase subunit G
MADAGMPEGCVRIAAAHPSTSTLGAMFGPVAIEAV